MTQQRLINDKIVPEILAPAGGMPQFFAALNSGADAVYLGLKQFNARARAANFSLDELRAIAPIARAHDMKILVTLNVLIKEIELKELIEVLVELQTSDIHAVIVQDMALVKIIRDHFPDLRIHASTQMAIHNPAGAMQAADWGIKRAVLARELTAQELRLIRTAVPRERIELEAFCHGSLCYSYSGLCFFSGIDDGRSGNRGECAYTCREPYKIINEPGHGFLFSMGDLDTSDSVAKFVDAGIDTLKIEGRKKDAQYVSAVVRLYRKKLDDYFKVSTLRTTAPATAIELPSEEQIRDDLSYSFQRKTTSFFFNGRYHENVIDLNSPTHLGNLAGTVLKIENGWCHFRTEVKVSVHDGVKIQPADRLYHASPQHGDQTNANISASVKRYENQEIQFGISEMRINGKRSFDAPIGANISIRLPNDIARIETGWQVRKVRSVKLKEATESLSRPSHRMIPRETIRLNVKSIIDNSAGAKLLLHFTASVGDEMFFQDTFSTSEFALAANRGVDRVIQENFQVLGDSGIVVYDFDFEGEFSFAIAPKELKTFKRQFAQQVPDKLQAWKSRRILHIAEPYRFAATAAEGVKLPKADQLPLTVKIDRMEYLPALLQAHASGSTIGEVILEPKRAFLGSRSIEDIAKELRSFQTVTNAVVRLAIPSIVRLWDEPLLKRWVIGFMNSGFSAFEIGNISGFRLLTEWGINTATTDISGDFSCYALNHQAAEFWAENGLKRLALSIEDDRENAQLLLQSWPAHSMEAQLIVFKDSPLFIAEACSLTALHNGCPTAKVCGYRTLEIENAKKQRYFVAHESCRSIVYGDKAFSIVNSFRPLTESGLVRSLRADFLTRPYENDSIVSVLHSISNYRPIVNTHSGNFLDSLL